MPMIAITTNSSTSVKPRRSRHTPCAVTAVREMQSPLPARADGTPTRHPAISAAGCPVPGTWPKILSFAPTVRQEYLIASFLPIPYQLHGFHTFHTLIGTEQSIKPQTPQQRGVNTNPAPESPAHRCPTRCLRRMS